MKPIKLLGMRMILVMVLISISFSVFGVDCDQLDIDLSSTDKIQSFARAAAISYLNGFSDLDSDDMIGFAAVYIAAANGPDNGDCAHANLDIGDYGLVAEEIQLNNVIVYHIGSAAGGIVQELQWGQQMCDDTYGGKWRDEAEGGNCWFLATAVSMVCTTGENGVCPDGLECDALDMGTVNQPEGGSHLEDCPIHALFQEDNIDCSSNCAESSAVYAPYVYTDGLTCYKESTATVQCGTSNALRWRLCPCKPPE